MTTFHPDLTKDNPALDAEENLDNFLEHVVALLRHLYSDDTLARFGVVIHPRRPQP